MRSLFLSVIIAFCLCSAKAQDVEPVFKRSRDAASVFIDMPRDMAIMLTDDSRKEMVALFANKKEAKVQNLSGGESELLELAHTYLKLRLTEQNTFELKLLYNNSGAVICVVQTACAPVCDSRISLYTIKWEPITDAQLLPQLLAAKFLNNRGMGSDARRNALANLDVHFFRYELNAKNDKLKIVYTTPNYLNSDARMRVAPFLTGKPVVLQWKLDDGFR